MQGKGLSHISSINTIYSDYYMNAPTNQEQHDTQCLGWFDAVNGISVKIEHIHIAQPAISAQHQLMLQQC